MLNDFDEMNDNFSEYRLEIGGSTSFVLSRVINLRMTSSEVPKPEVEQAVNNTVVTGHERPSSLQPVLPEAGPDEFGAIDLRIGTILSAVLNKKARKPAYVLTIDFGKAIGIKKSSSQLTHHYEADALVGRQIVAAVNLGVRRIASVKSEVLVLGVDKVGDGRISLLGVDGDTPNGARVI
ncbi:hypothetical protein V1512DRAFT_291311 [Lipomyces arxii]|uniref:uncharacterized protein n=1 Tax=Lipomyces arxii TaxID=56418 RepID=UPI0034CD28CF